MVYSNHATAQDCYESSIINPSPFMGNNGEIFKLADGSYWKVKYEYEYLYEYYPSVVICPSRERLIVGDTSLTVEFVATSQDSMKAGSRQIVIESTIISDFDGLDAGNVYELLNGQIWEQTEVWIWIWVWVYPSVVIWNDGSGFKMKVENIDHAVAVRRIK